MKYLIFDVRNLLYRTFYANTKGNDSSTAAGLAVHSGLVTMNKYFREHKPDKVVMAYDRNSWRKAYTASPQCLSQKPYKGNRRQNMTPAEQAKFIEFEKHLVDFERVIADNTTIITMEAPNLEADDLIAGFVQKLNSPQDSHVLISTDTDMLQLLRHPNLTIVSPANDKVQTLEEYNNDPLLYLFVKCVRGDPTDNVQSAYPRVRETKIVQVYENTSERINFMQTKWTNQEGREFTVGEMFAENQLLIDLEKQPAEIRQLMDDTIEQALTAQKTFSMFNFLKFTGKYKLDAIRNSFENYLPMLSK